MSEIVHQHRLFCEYAETFKDNTPRTIQWYEDTFRSFLKDTGVQSIAEIDPLLIEAYIKQGKFDRQWSPKTIRNRMSALKLFLDWGVRKNLIDANPAANIELPKLRVVIPEHLTKDQSTELLVWTRNYRFSYKFERIRAIAIISLFIFTGIRAQELLNLNMEDVRLDNRSLFIRCGKGKKDRLIPLDYVVIKALENYIKDRDRLKRKHPRFFVSMKNDRPMPYKTMQLLIVKLRKASGIYFYAHMLRHTFAMLMLEGGADIFAIKELMGHSDIKTTMIYLTATSAHIRAEAKKHPLGITAALSH